MSYQEVGKLIDRWINDPTFRGEFRKDPEGTLRKTGVNLKSEELSALKKVDWNRSDEELKAIASKLLA